MPGNSIGNLFRVTTFGESHGLIMGGIVDGMPPGMLLSESDIQSDLNRRRPGSSKYSTNRIESDSIKIVSGVFKGKTTGTSIGLLIENKNYISEDYDNIKNVYRPGHADYSYSKKYGIRDYRGGGRSSARETVIRVAAGAIAKKYLIQNYGILIRGFLSQMGNIKCYLKDWNQISMNPFFCPDKERILDLHNLIKNLKKNGDSIGAKITIIVDNVPAGLGEPVFDRLDADIAHALMSINAVKGVEIGDGFSVVNQKGSENRDSINIHGFKSNHSGGILGGISSGQQIIVHIACKPTSSISLPIETINEYNEVINLKIKGRHDPCIGIRAVPIAEAMIAIIIMDHVLRNKAQCK